MQLPKTILLIENEPQVRDVLKEVLERAGYCVFHARGGAEGLRLFEQHGSTFDLVVTGMLVPEIEALVRQHPEVRLLVLSTEGAMEPTPGVPILAKPFTPDALIRAVREILSDPQKPPGAASGS
jgi:DNA-binding response OmpR family regulator